MGSKGKGKPGDTIMWISPAPKKKTAAEIKAEQLEARKKQLEADGYVNLNKISDRKVPVHKYRVAVDVRSYDAENNLTPEELYKLAWDKAMQRIRTGHAEEDIQLTTQWPLSRTVIEYEKAYRVTDDGDILTYTPWDRKFPHLDKDWKLENWRRGIAGSSLVGRPIGIERAYNPTGNYDITRIIVDLFIPEIKPKYRKKST